jgi:phosphoribosylformimino-5-aminoimidazole carboxamide ribonucleotide (ProFAR) isomerase
VHLVVQVDITDAAADAGAGVVARVSQAVDAGATFVALRDPIGRWAAAADTPLWLRTLASLDIDVRYDGSLTDPRAIERIARLPFDDMVIGVNAAADPSLLRWSIDLLGPRLVVDVPVDDSYLFDPPAPMFGVEVIEVLRLLGAHGTRRAIWRDVTANEVPLGRIRGLASATGMDLDYHGPINSVTDLADLAAIAGDVVTGVIVGEPLFDGSIDMGEATRIASR